MNSKNFSLVGQNPQFINALNFGTNLALSKSPLLICGEIGTGKTEMAHFIHANSARASQPVIVIDCSLDPVEVENNILGYRDSSGAFNKGAFEQGNGGTVVLQNVECLEEKFQKKLQTIISELADFDLDIRLIATTSKILSKYVTNGRFIRSLYNFFSKSTINMPSLRDRKEDIRDLCEFFLEEYLAAHPNKKLQFNEDIFPIITEYYWTQNIKELKEVIENAIENCTGEYVDVKAIEQGEKTVEMKRMDNDEDGIKLMSLRDAEQLLIKKALMHTSENRTQAAKILGVSIRTLRNKINEYRTGGSAYFANLR